jgi:hypothetical protein
MGNDSGHHGMGVSFFSRDKVSAFKQQNAFSDGASL